MPDADLVRPSRDGDQFHYTWAARQCLRLLPGREGLVAVTIEGPSALEAKASPPLPSDELIDVGLYFGSEDLKAAHAIRYVQLKHSTRRTDEPWTASGLKSTIERFAARYAKLRDQFTAEDVAARFAFAFTTNRPIAVKVRETCEDIASGAKRRHASLSRSLVRCTRLGAADARRFFALLSVEGGEHGLWEQRNLLAQDLRGYLPEADYDAPVQLKELVTRKATTEFESNPSIRRYDVLRALKVTEDLLQPAPSQIVSPPDALRREQESEIREAVLEARVPVVLHADGGVGKSVMAALLAERGDAGSESVLYDCYGDGLYRHSLNFRHRHRDAIVQMANELSSRGLCHPLIPTSHADSKLYMAAFLHRLRQAADVLRGRNANSILTLIIDAADNAELAAAEQKEPSSFVRDLVRAPLPEGVRLVLTCRTHRRDLLHAPLEALDIELRPFSLKESAINLRRRHPEATDAEAEEFAVLSSHNPRVQALALDQNLTLDETLRQLGPTPTTVEQTISDLLSGAIIRLRDKVGPIESARIDDICRGLAVLRPLVPIPVLAALSGVAESAIRSFAYDLGRPLLIKGDSLHFLDEPAETWFRDTYRPDAAGLSAFVDRLRPLAEGSSYVAAVLPQLLVDVGRLDEVVTLALSDQALPTANPLERRDVELQRLTFALKASLRGKLHVAAAKLALKAGGECAGEQRQNSLIQANTDIAAALMAPDRIEEVVSRRTFDSGWMGSHHAYDAGFLSGRQELAAEASSRLRMAMEWLMTWARASREARDGEDVSDLDRAELTLTILRLRGPREAARFLRRWRHRRLAFDAGLIVGRRLADLGRLDQLAALAEAAGNDVWLLLALARSARAVGAHLPVGALRILLRLLAARRVKLEESTQWNENWNLLYAVTSAIESALQVLEPEHKAWADILSRYLPAKPPREFTSRYGFDPNHLLRAYALEAALRGRRLALADVAPDDIKAEIDEAKRSHSQSHEAEVFRFEVGGRLPWAILAAEVLCGRAPDLAADLDAARKASEAAERRAYDHHDQLQNSLAIDWLGILLDAGARAAAQLPNFESWCKGLKTPLWPDTLVTLCRRAARSEGLADLALDLCGVAVAILEKSREEAETRSDSYVRLARAVFAVSPAEAQATFDKAVEISSRIGDENLDRWTAMLDLASAAAEAGVPRARTAYRLSRVAELTYEYVVRDKHFDWERTVEAIAGLCPTSAFAILSRWRDRSFGYAGRLLPDLVYFLMKQGSLPASTPVILAGLDARWRRTKDLKRFLSAEVIPDRRVAGANIAFRYIRLLPHTRQEWDELRSFAVAQDLSLPDLERLAEFTPEEPKKEAEKASYAGGQEIERRSPVWDEVFSGVDVGDSSALHAAYLALRTYDPPYQFETFFREACERTPAGREPELVRAFLGWADFGMFELRYLLDAVPQRWRTRLAFRAALRDVVLGVCERSPTRVFRRSWYKPIPFDDLAADGLVTDADVVDATLAGFVNEVDGLAAGELFHMTETLASKLTPAEAEEVVEFGLDLLEGTLRPEDGDGPWRPKLAPAGNLDVALAGYIWAGLASPVAAERWAHAHVVRSIIELGRTDMLDALIAHVSEADGGAFAAEGLVFYGWHARLWLLIGIARGTLERPSHATSAIPYLLEAVEEDHVLIRAFAASALAILEAAGLTPDGTASRLAAVNRPTHPPHVHDDWSTYLEVVAEDAPPETVTDDEKYYFGIDIAPYWFRPLGHAFGITEESVERRARRVLKARMGWSGGGWRDDARHARGIFRDGETHHSHGAMPKTDDLTAYHSYHAMMMVAAELLEERAPRQHVDDPADAFTDWLDRHLISRPDGRWLADYRGPRITAEPPRSRGYADTEWAWSVSADYLDRQLIAPDGRTVLWGHWTSGSEDSSETVSVRSALVTRSVAEALVAAMQTAPDLSRFGLPSLDAHDTLRFSTGSLVGWIHDHGRDRGLDEGDPWSEGLHYPGPSPGVSFAEMLQLEARDADGRRWSCRGGGTLLNEIWTQVEGLGREASTVPGWRLTADEKALAEIERLRPDERLILSVDVRRLPPKYGQNRRELVDYPWPYCRYYLIGPHGEPVSL